MFLVRKNSILDDMIPANEKPLSQSVKNIIKNRKYKDGKVIASVPTLETLTDLYGVSLPIDTMTFDQFIGELQKKAIDNTIAANAYIEMRDGSIVKLPTAQAFNNCNGKWTEVGYAIFAWNALAKMNRAARQCANGGTYDVYIYVKLPNRTSSARGWTQLLDVAITKELAAYPMIMSKEIKVSSNIGRAFELISSNPDSVILKFGNLEANALWDTTEITDFDPYTNISYIKADVVGSMDSLFDKFKGKVLPSANLQCFLSVKRSLRPDRRYQWIHEGDHVKAILQWIAISSKMHPVAPLDAALSYDDLNGKFFAVSLSKVSKDDHNAMDTGLAGSIVSPSLAPVWAVDKLFECLSFDKIEEQIKQMIAFK